MIVIGITGGIASGKSTVARMIARHHIPHIDADKLVHQLMAHDKQVIADIAQYFPEAVQHNNIDRKKLGVAIAGEPKKLKQLEELLHPRVREAEEQAILKATRQRRKAIILDVPLLFETDADSLCDVVIAVTAPLAMRKRRAMNRMHMSEATFNRIIARQLSDAERCQRADVVLPSTLGKATMQRTLRRLLKEWGL